MQVQKRTDTSFANPVMGRREMTLRQQSHRERVHGAKSSIDTSAPLSQPHLTLYGRDYAAKKKATTEAAFMDLKMIQTIARTMTRKTEVEQRKGPVSLNADGRKAEIYRVMHENHRLLESIEGCAPCMRTADLVKDHREKTRYIINSSHTMRLSGEYDMEILRIKREDASRLEMKKQSTESRLMASKMRNTTGSVSLPSLTGTTRSDPGHAQPGHAHSQPAPMSQSASAPLKQISQTSQMSSQMSHSQSAGGLAGASKVSAKVTKINAQGEMRPSPGPPPQRKEADEAAADTTEPASSSSTGSKEKPAKSTPKRVSKKPAVEPVAVVQQEPAAVAASSSSGKRASVAFAPSDDIESVDEPETNARRAKRMSTPHHSKLSGYNLEEEEDDDADDMTPAPTGEDPEAGDGQASSERAATKDAEEEVQAHSASAGAAELTAPELEASSTQAMSTVDSDEEANVDEAIAAVELAENSTGVDEAEVLGTLSSSLSSFRLSKRVSSVLTANGWNGSGFDTKPDFHHVLQQLQSTREELAADAAIAAVEDAEHRDDMNSEAVDTLSHALARASVSKRVSVVLAHHGWTGSEFGEAPNFHNLLVELQEAKAVLHKEAETGEPQGEPAKQEVQGGADDGEDEYEDEFIDASADSLNMSRTLKSHDAPQDEAFEASATFEEQTETGEIA